jgi:hypothetical protein
MERTIKYSPPSYPHPIGGNSTTLIPTRGCWCDMHDVHQLKFLLKCLLKRWIGQHYKNTQHDYAARITANKQPHPPKSHSESTTQRVVWVSFGNVTSIVDTKRDSYFSVLYVLCVISYGAFGWEVDMFYVIPLCKNLCGLCHAQTTEHVTKQATIPNKDR